jgi:intracellular septation protein
VTLNPRLKLFFDILPLVVFFAGYKWLGLFAATGALLVVTLAILAVTYWVERRIALSPLVTGIVVGVFGGLTLWLHDETFIKIKPTLINLVFASILLVGCIRKKGLLKPILGGAFDLTDKGWFVLSRRWGLFFLFLAGLNELVWRNFTTDQWVNFKVFGLLGLTMAFALLQMGLVKKYQTTILH